MNESGCKDKGPRISGADFDRGDKSQSKRALLDYIPNFAVDNLVASIDLSLGNTEEERDRMINLMRRRASDGATTLSKI